MLHCDHGESATLVELKLEMLSFSLLCCLWHNSNVIKFPCQKRYAQVIVPESHNAYSLSRYFELVKTLTNQTVLV